MVSPCYDHNLAIRSLLSFKAKPSKPYSLGIKLKLYKDLRLFCLMPDVCSTINDVKKIINSGNFYSIANFALSQKLSN